MFIVIFGLLCASAAGLECRNGFELRATPPVITPQGDWTTKKCEKETETFCMRGEGNVEALGLSFALITGECVTKERCMGQCATLLKTTLTAEENGTGLFEPEDLTISSCEITCCSTNNCNNNTIADILIMNQSLLATTLSMQEDTTTGSAGCDIIYGMTMKIMFASLFAVFSSFWNLS